MVRLGRTYVGALVGVLLVGAGCSGPSTSLPTQIGTFTIASAAFNADHASGFVFSGTSTIVAVADYGAVCTHGLAAPNGKVLAVALAAVDTAGNASPVSANGRYVIVNNSTQAVDGLYAQAFFEHMDGTCNPDVELEVVAGDVTVTGVDSAAMAGDLHLTAFENSVTTAQNPTPQRTGDQVNAHFEAGTCPTLTFNSTPLCP